MQNKRGFDIGRSSGNRSFRYLKFETMYNTYMQASKRAVAIDRRNVALRYLVIYIYRSTFLSKALIMAPSESDGEDYEILT